MDNVFNKISDAANNGRGVELTASEVWLLTELAGDEIAKAGGTFETWQDMFEDYDREKRRDTDN